MLLTTGSHTANPHVAKNLPYDALKDFAPITQLAGSYGLALITTLPVNSVAELVAAGEGEARHAVLRHVRRRQPDARRPAGCSRRAPASA